VIVVLSYLNKDSFWKSRDNTINLAIKVLMLNDMVGA
jgi:hypothetical protein